MAGDSKFSRIKSKHGLQCVYLNANYWATSRHIAISGKFVKFLVSSVATPPSVRAEWAFKIFDSDEDQLLGERDIRLSVIRHQVLSSIYKGVTSVRKRLTTSSNKEN